MSNLLQVATNQALAALLQSVIQAGTTGSPSSTALSVIVLAPNSTKSEITLAAAGVAQALLAGATPANGFSIYNASQTEPAFFRENGAASYTGSSGSWAPGAGTEMIAPGATFTTPPGYKATGPLSFIAATLAHPIVVRS